MPGTIFGFDADTVNAFDKAYRASLKPELAALMDMNTAPASDGSWPRADAFRALAMKGDIVDFPIMVLNGGAFFVMNQRHVDGYDWVPSALQSGTGGTGQTPPGSITVVTDPSKLIPYAPVIPPTPAPGVVGTLIGTSDEVGIMPPTRLYMSQAAYGHFAEGALSVAPDGAVVYYHLLGTSLMDHQTRVGVWIEKPAA